MKCYFKKTMAWLRPGDQNPVMVLLPEDAKSERWLKKYALGDVFYFDFKKPRNYEFHKKFFAMLKVVFDNQKVFETPVMLLDVIKIKTGHVETVLDYNKQVLSLKPASISFAAMDQTQFEDFYSRAVDEILANLLVGTSEEDLNNQVLQVLSFT